MKQPYTQVPNWLFMIMKSAEKSEILVTLAIARNTSGYHRKTHRMSLTFFMKETGLSKQAVLDGIEAAVKRQTIVRTKKKNSFVYGLNPVYSVDRLQTETVYSLDRFTIKTVYSLDQGRLLIRPFSVYSLDPVKEKRKNNKEKSCKHNGSGLDDPRIVLEDPPRQEPKPTPANVKTSALNTHKYFDPRKISPVDGCIPAGKGTTPTEVYLEYIPWNQNNPIKSNQARAMSEDVTDMTLWRKVLDTCKAWSNPVPYRVLQNIQGAIG